MQDIHCMSYEPLIIFLGMTKHSLLYSVFMGKILRRKKAVSFKSVHLIKSDINISKIPSCYGIPGGTLFIITIGTSCLLLITYSLSLIIYHLTLTTYHILLIT